MMSQGLKGKIAIVTAGAAGIGGGTTRRLADEGAHVVVVDIDAEAAHSMVAELPGDHLAVAADATTSEGVESYMTAALDRFGAVDLAHLNVGAFHRAVPTAELTMDEFDRVFDLVLRSNILGLRAVLTQLVEQGRGGSVVVTSSLGGILGGKNGSAYSAAKHGLVGLVRSSAAEYGPLGIRVNALCPGFTNTPMNVKEFGSSEAGIAQRAAIEASIPARRFGEPAELGSAAAWLLSDDASYVNGTTLVVDGGMTCSL